MRGWLPDTPSGAPIRNPPSGFWGLVPASDSSDRYALCRPFWSHRMNTVGAFFMHTPCPPAGYAVHFPNNQTHPNYPPYASETNVRSQINHTHGMHAGFPLSGGPEDPRVGPTGQVHQTWNIALNEHTNIEQYAYQTVQRDDGCPFEPVRYAQKETVALSSPLQTTVLQANGLRQTPRLAPRR